jgi:hypothetical protein
LDWEDLNDSHSSLTSNRANKRAAVAVAAMLPIDAFLKMMWQVRPIAITAWTTVPPILEVNTKVGDDWYPTNIVERHSMGSIPWIISTITWTKVYCGTSRWSIILAVGRFAILHSKSLVTENYGGNLSLYVYTTVLFSNSP